MKRERSSHHRSKKDSRSRKDSKKDKRDRKDKKEKRGKRERSIYDVDSSSSDSDSEAVYSSITGQRILRHVDKDEEDHVRDANRATMRQFLNQMH